ncbi:hypothetical protein [Magnetospirillum sulfuroxidans]|uniref:Uncharacterized protein n=1 Tax=Magnetospirillum sulfuroxidans TaxID=611300 RepID=A0ABS5I8H7_9PROT|nr:hypothetical protein [Magnetospirillum sulfuroxidans]MBR9970561.1 hypothetical protein [Magnetospirillum sulfuroxidans]
MPISALGASSPAYPASASAPVRAPEATERGPDRDNDGDEGGVSAAAKALPTPPPGRGGKMDMLA